MPNPTYTPAQLADEVQTLAENYRSTFVDFNNISDAIDYCNDGTEAYHSKVEGLEAEIAEDNEIFEDISEAIQSKTGQAEPYGKENLASTISSEWVVPVEEKDVNFFDYDGTLLYSYSSAEAYTLTMLPALPQHSGLTASGWTYTLAEIKNYLNDGQTVDVGVYYETSDGHTRLHLVVEDSESLPSQLQLYTKIRNGTLNISINGAIYTSETESANSEVNHAITISLQSSSVYPAEYTIDLSFTGDGYYVIGQGTASTAIFSDNPKYLHLLKGAEIGSNCHFSAYAFYFYYALESIILPETLSKFENYNFYGCSSLRCIVAPTQLTELSEQTFRNCTALERIVLPKAIMTLKYCDFYNCASLKSIIIPSTVTQCGSYAFYYCISLKTVKLSGITAMGTELFSGCLSLERIIIENCTTLNNGSFANCPTLVSVKISGSITINQLAFNQCIKLFSIDLTAYGDASSIPVLAATNALSSTPSTQKIFVLNQEMLEAFSTATNWSTYADRFQIKPSEV